ncbi:MAG TPA: D-alanyl-D-alanine carboxypeptidase/D-alanyl-D-alanine-endopeptidase, partial [Longimicrobiaceae bacterium]|nr:D-alanyl-D-alanine carboxypeptidase/D-alanyl-D-alanine-endopeptidase [Longimicrobiaceae bacterium]
LKTVGRAVTGVGSFSGGERAVRRMLPRGVAGEALRMEDGSGLSRLDRLTARAVVALLAEMARGPLAEAFRASLPAAGDPEGLERRMRGTPAAGNLRAKTGTLATVSALSGYVTGADGERLAFAILANGVSSPARAKEVEDRIGARLAAFRR